ncbi:MAG: manganese efflux pump [Bacteroidaceae bacterium]|nr:manganese efflux pump [Bacteroidaceae bacterium]MBR3625256.1 manganese efflux pump [Bacteroidaceae bacterium]
MSALDLWLLAIGLAMDCFTVSIASGIILKRIEWKPILSMAFCFGLFQALMPLISWALFVRVGSLLQQIDHWVAFGLLLFLGGNMIREAFSKEEEHHFNPHRWVVILTLAVATSIDALAVGISFAFIGFNTLTSMVYPLVVIGLVSFVFSLVGSGLGIWFGIGIAKKLKPELLGGIILIIIGCKIVIQHLANGL